MTIVTLTWGEVWFASEVARMRGIKNLQRKLQDRYGDTGTLGFDYHLIGCLGEMAVAKFTGRYWTGSVGDFDAPDVGEFQVRTCTQPDHCLILHDADKDNELFFSALVRRESLPEIELRGYIEGSAGKLKRFWREDTSRPAYFLPAEALWPVEHAIPG